MTRKTRKAAAFAVAVLSVGTVTAFAATSPPLVGVTKSAMNGVNRAAGSNGALKANAVGNRQIKFGSVSCGKLSLDLKAALCTGKPGAPGTPGAPGANGSSGSKGGNGSNGNDGSNGKDAPAAQYGVAVVNVNRGTGYPVSPWATYSTRLGSPVGDTTGGTFRFTCNLPGPCTVKASAAALSGSSDNVTVYPRLLIYTESLNGGPEMYCEYGDGPGSVVPKQASTASPALQDLPIDIGGSADCSGPDATHGTIAQITVPAGYYDVQSTFVFHA